MRWFEDWREQELTTESAVEANNSESLPLKFRIPNAIEIHSLSVGGLT